ncbi:MAG: response regulator [Myxococcota bacterium]
MARAQRHAAEILLVEDELADAVLVRKALSTSSLTKIVHHVSDGREAMAFLKQEAPYEEVHRPDLVLLDLNMPVMSGQETLKAIRSDPELSVLPVVVMTSSARDEDVVSSYELHANCYVRKPLDLGDFHETIRSVEAFWLSVVSLPRRTA